MRIDYPCREALNPIAEALAMKRWDIADMQDVGRKLFAKIHKQKYHAHHNHEIHFMAREIEEWMPQGIQSMKDGTYTPRCLKRYYFPDEVVDQLHVSDRIFQNVLLKQLKPTFKHVMNKNCHHLSGPTGVKYATERIRQVLQDDSPQFLLRVDIQWGETNTEHQTQVALQIIPHPRTLRKARMHVQQMVTIGLSAKLTRRYLHKFLLWWVKTSNTWQYPELISWFCETCWDINPVGFAAGLLQRHFKKSHTQMFLGLAA